MRDSVDSRQNSAGGSVRARRRRKLYKNPKAWAWAIGTIISLCFLWIAWRQYCDTKSSPTRQAKAEILHALESFELQMQQVERGIQDSVQAARSRAGERWVLPSGGAWADEMRRVLRPLEELVRDEWTRLRGTIRESLVESGVGDTVLAETAEFSDLQPNFDRAEARKDSVLAKIRRELDQASVRR
jgi:hypothetical protein